MRRTFAALAFTAALASGAATLALMPNGGEVIAAPTSATFVVPAHDGYGIAECLASNSECAKVVADAWCESQGFMRAESFGMTVAEDVTGSVRKVAMTESARPFSVTCTK